LVAHCGGGGRIGHYGGDDFQGEGIGDERNKWRGGERTTNQEGAKNGTRWRQPEQQDTRRGSSGEEDNDLRRGRKPSPVDRPKNGPISLQWTP
jgi:hypothetical protein